jgi:hypothetical protein
MKKIPLESTIVGSYKFLFQNIISIIGTIWLPFVIALAAVGALLYAVVPHQWLACDFSPIADPGAYVRAKLPMFMIGVPVIMITGLLTGAMIRVGLLRHALGEKTKTTWVYLSLGARVWRMIGAILLIIVIAYAIELAIIVLVAASHFILAAIPNVPMAVAILVKAVIILVGVIFAVSVIARLAFFLPAVVVAENKVGVSKAWQLGKGNVWRILAVLLAVIVPVMIIAGVVVHFTILASVLSVVATGHEPKTPAEVMTILKSLLPVLPVILAVYLVAGIAMAGLVAGAIGKAYKAVTAPDEVSA